MPAVAIQIADAVVAELNAEARSWAGQFTAARRWVPVFDDDDETLLQVSVVPVTRVGERISRSQVPGNWGLVIDFRKAPDAGGGTNTTPLAALNVAVDVLVELVESVREFFEDNHHLATLSTYQITDCQNPEIFEPNALYQSRKFLSEITLNVWGPE